MVTAPLVRMVRRVAPDLVTTTEARGRAMVAVATPGTAVEQRILRPRDIHRLGAATSTGSAPTLLPSAATRRNRVPSTRSHR